MEKKKKGLLIFLTGWFWYGLNYYFFVYSGEMGVLKYIYLSLISTLAGLCLIAGVILFRKDD